MVVADASLSSGWVGAFLQSDGGVRTLFPRGLAGLGWAIPAAVGAVEAGAPRVVAVMGTVPPPTQSANSPPSRDRARRW